MATGLMQLLQQIHQESLTLLAAGLPLHCYIRSTLVAVVTFTRLHLQWP